MCERSLASPQLLLCGCHAIATVSRLDGVMQHGPGRRSFSPALAWEVLPQLTHRVLLCRSGGSFHFVGHDGIYFQVRFANIPIPCGGFLCHSPSATPLPSRRCSFDGWGFFCAYGRHGWSGLTNGAGATEGIRFVGHGCPAPPSPGLRCDPTVGSFLNGSEFVPAQAPATNCNEPHAAR